MVRASVVYRGPFFLKKMTKSDGSNVTSKNHMNASSVVSLNLDGNMDSIDWDMISILCLR